MADSPRFHPVDKKSVPNDRSKVNEYWGLRSAVMDNGKMFDPTSNKKKEQPGVRESGLSLKNALFSMLENSRGQ